MALMIKQRTGRGQYIDMSSCETLNTLIGDRMVEYGLSGSSPGRDGNHDGIVAPHNVYPCDGDDSWISIAVTTDEEWRSLRSAMGEPAWAHDADIRHESGPVGPAGRTRPADRRMDRDASRRRADRASCRRTVSPRSPPTRQRTCSPTRTCWPAGASSRFRTPGWARARRSAHPGTCPHTPARVSRSAPLLGADNDYVLGDLLGLSTEEVAQLVDEQIVY